MALYGVHMCAAPDMVSAKLLPENWQFGGSSMNLNHLNLKMEVSLKFEGCSSAVVNRSSVAPVEDEMRQKVESCGSVDQSRISGISLSPKEMKSLPKPLSATDVSSCQSKGSKLRVAYQGVPGAYSEDAALKAYPKCKTVPCKEFEAAFKAVESLVAEKAVLPIENSVAGSVHRNYDLLLSHRLHIVGEVHFPVHHCLLGLPGVRKEELKYVLSHPQALAQCEFALNMLNADRLNSADTAGAAQTVASNGLRHTGVIASARAGLLYGLNILAENIQDDHDNITRFLILAREPVIPRTDKPYKTSIVFTVEDDPGVLVKALAIFALRGINLSRIESRPHRKQQLKAGGRTNRGRARYFEYLFYVDFDASMAEPCAQSALGQLQEFVKFLRVLGSYPTDTAL